MKSTGQACTLLLLTMAAVSSGRNARDYFQHAGFQYSPSRPEDALVLFVGKAPLIICEPEKDRECVGGDPEDAHFCLALPHGYTHYTCSFEGNETISTNLKLIADIIPHIYLSANGWVRVFTEKKMYCTTNSQLPDEYFHMRVQRPHEDRPAKCRLLIDDGRLYVRFPGYPTILCEIGTEAGTFPFNVPGIAEDPFRCAFRVYSELPLGDAHTEQRLYQSLISGLPSRFDGTRPRVVCSRDATPNGTAHFQLVLHGGATYDCSFGDAAPRYLS